MNQVSREPALAMSLWLPVVAPAVWTLHLLATYITVALSCGDDAAAIPFGGVHLAAAAYTALALVPIVWSFAAGLRLHDYRWPGRPHDDDTPEDRRHFLGFTTMLLAGLSVIGTLFVGGSVFFVKGCG